MADPQQVILKIIKETLAPVFSGLVLCAILTATTNVMAAHILIVASNLAEDFYKKFRKTTTSKELLWISRLSVILIALIGYWIAYFKPSTIYQLVLYAWSGLGASFGPLVLLSLYAKNINKYGAFAGIFVGGLITAIWPYFDQMYQLEVAPIIPGFFLGLISIQVVSAFTSARLPSRASL